jgi:hypothetical protein
VAGLILSMSQQPEKRYETNVNKHLQQPVYHEAMGTGYSAGTPDRWYDGPARDLWAEYKFYPKLPPLVDLTKKLTPLQQRWLNRAYENGRNVAVIVGTAGAKGVIFTGNSWKKPLTREEFQRKMEPSKTIAARITNFVCTL